MDGAVDGGSRRLRKWDHDACGRGRSIQLRKWSPTEKSVGWDERNRV